MTKDNKMILTEWFEISSDSELLREQDLADVNSGKNIMVGIMQKCDAENGNGRVYPRKVLEREVKNYQKLVKERRALGELDHPDSSVIELKNASHLVTDIWWDGDRVMGKVEILDTPSGGVLKSLADAKVKLGISSRGLGTTNERMGKTMVNDDFQLICFDIVSEPSTTGAFMMAEGKTPNIITKADRINRALNDILD
tara:strand:+ start:1121 stop:1714 length:594 start_codon:yes stop_codon:yes gene_type:complete